MAGSQGWSGRRWAAFTAGTFLAVAVLTTVPAYGRNLYDNGNAILGTSAPTLPFALGGLAMIGAAMSARELVTRSLGKRWLWGAVTALNSIVMTLFLWHMTAYFAATAALVNLGLTIPSSSDLTWWAERPLFLVAPAIVLTPLVWIFAAAERSAVGSRAPAIRSFPLAGAPGGAGTRS
jgi:hypothetical protein